MLSRELIRGVHIIAVLELFLGSVCVFLSVRLDDHDMLCGPSYKCVAIHIFGPLMFNHQRAHVNFLQF